MTPETALWLIFALNVVLVFVGAPLAFAFREEFDRAKAKVQGYTALGLMTLLIGAVVIVAWWYYALATDQILLAVIPTTTWVANKIVQALLKITRDNA